jgi:glycosyltransferase involved in cell wall biosynthesis
VSYKKGILQKKNRNILNRKLNILFLTARFPFPLIGGDRLKPYMVLKHLAKKHNVHLVSFNQGGQPTEAQIEGIRELGVMAHPIALDAIKASIRVLPLTLFAGQPLEIAYYNQPEFAVKVDSLMKNTDFDIVISFFMRTAEYVKDKKIKKILMAEDCRELYQERSYEGSRHSVQKLVRWWEVKKLRKYEPAIMEKFDVATFVTENDIVAMKRINPNANYRLLTNGTDINAFVPPPPESSSRKGILFAGKLDIWANVLMIDRIVKNIMPRVWVECPDVEFQIAGANPPKKIEAMAGDKIKLSANVPDMLPYLQRAAIFVHPHSGGSGIQNKLIEAMASGCAVVTTETGTQGLPAENGKNIMIGKNDAEIASYIITLLKNKELTEEIGKNARKAIVENLSWEVVYNQTDRILSELTG